MVWRALEGGHADKLLRERAQPVAVHGELLQARQDGQAGRQRLERVVRHVQVLQRLRRIPGAFTCKANDF